MPKNGQNDLKFGQNKYCDHFINSNVHKSCKNGLVNPKFWLVMHLDDFYWFSKKFWKIWKISSFKAKKTSLFFFFFFRNANFYGKCNNFCKNTKIQSIVAYTLRNIFAKNEVNWTIFANVTFSVEVCVPKKEKEKAKNDGFLDKKELIFQIFWKINRNHSNT